MRVYLQFPVNHCYCRMSVSSLGTYKQALVVTRKNCLGTHKFTYCWNFEVNCYCLDLIKLCLSFTHFIGDNKLLKGSGCKKIILNQNKLYVFWLYINTSNMNLYKSASATIMFRRTTNKHMFYFRPYHNVLDIIPNNHANICVTTCRIYCQLEQV